MPQTHDIGSAFVHRVSLQRGTPLIHRAPTNEIEEPFRRSNSVVVRFFRSGLVFGWWQVDPDRTEEEALLAALTLGDHGGHDFGAAHALASPEVEDEDRTEGEDTTGRVDDAGNARPAVIHF